MFMFDFAISIFTCIKTSCCMTYVYTIFSYQKKNVESGPSHIPLEQGPHPRANMTSEEHHREEKTAN